MRLEKRYEYLNCILNHPKIKLVIKINMQNCRAHKSIGLWENSYLSSSSIPGLLILT